MLESLNVQQQQAVLTTEGPLLLFAGAGTGKTRTLTHRLTHIINSKLATPDNILALTFTRKASNVMRQRVHGLLNTNSHSSKLDFNFMPYLGTFHGVCHRILRLEFKAANLAPNFVIYDRNNCRKLMESLLERKPFSFLHLTSARALAVISRFKDQTSSSYDQITHQELYESYQTMLRRLNAVDFDDLIILTVQLLKDNLEIRTSWQTHLRYVMVDEYQDTNLLQYELIKLLTPPSNNLMVVGDDWQSIYQWRGANYKAIFNNFLHDYPQVKIIHLEQNYRSKQNILDAGGAIINKITTRSQKKLWSQRGQGEKIKVWQVNSDVQEARVIAFQIKKLVKSKNYTYRDMAVFYRVNSLSRNLEQEFAAWRVPYKIYDQQFYDRPEITNLVAYLRLIYQPNDQISFNQVINLPTQRLSPTALKAFDRWLADNDLKLDEGLNNLDSNQSLNFKQKQTLKSFNQWLVNLRQASLTPVDLILEIIRQTNYLKTLKERNFKNTDRADNVQEFLNVAKKFNDLDLGSFLEEIALLGRHQGQQKSANAVSLMTLHAAKGLEFPVVFIIGFEENLLPHYYALKGNQADLDEERRICYVGITRAEDDLYLLYANNRSNSPSRFLKEIPSRLISRHKILNILQN